MKACLYPHALLTLGLVYAACSSDGSDDGAAMTSGVGGAGGGVTSGAGGAANGTGAAASVTGSGGGARSSRCSAAERGLMPDLSGKSPERADGVPASGLDGCANFEGPVWTGDSRYGSEIPYAVSLSVSAGTTTNVACGGLNRTTLFITTLNLAVHGEWSSACEACPSERFSAEAVA